MNQNRLTQWIQLLNNVETSGKQNMLNLVYVIEQMEKCLQEEQASGMDRGNRDISSGGTLPDGRETNP